MGIVKDYWKLLTQICEKNPKGKPYDEKGQFYPDPTPVAPPVGHTNVADIDMFEVMRSRIRNEASIQAQLAGYESFEEADDFEVEEDFEPFSPWEEITEQFRPDGPAFNPEKQPPGGQGGKGGGSLDNPPPPPPDGGKTPPKEPVLAKEGKSGTV